MKLKKSMDISELNMKRNIMGKIAKLFINKSQMALLLIILIVSSGFISISNLPKESLPEIIFPRITVQTIYPGASPEDVEDLVTDKLESKLSDLEDLDDMVSQSNFGYSSIILTFVEGTDMDKKKIEVDNKITELSFSDGIQEPVTSIFKTSEIPLMNLSIAGDYSIFDLTQLSEDIKEALERIEGVEEVNLYGDLDREIHVIINETKMFQYGITSTDIQNAVSSLNIGIPVGEIDLSGMRFNLRVNEKIATVESIENIVILTTKGETIFVRDVAAVLDTSEPITEYNRTYLNQDENEDIFPSILAEVVRENESDVVGTSKRVKAFLESQRGRLYPDDIDIYISNDTAEEVQNDLNNIRESAVSGLIAVIIVLFIFIGFKESLIVSVTIPLSLLATLGLLSSFGITLNTFTVLGLIVALGLLVDNSIIVMENIDRLSKKGLEAKEASLAGTNQIGFPILASTLTTLAAFFPLAILPGILGDFVKTIPRTIMIAISASLLVSIAITPTIYSKFLKHKKRKKQIWETINEKNKSIFIILLIGALSYYAFSGSGDSPLLAVIAALFFSSIMAYKKLRPKGKNQEESKMVKVYKNIIAGIIENGKKKALIIFIGILVFTSSLGLFVIGAVKVSFFPDNEPESMTITIDTPGGTTLEETAEIAEKVQSLLVKSPDISIFNTTIGGNEIDKAVINASFVDKEKLNKDGFDMVNETESAMKKIPGAQIIVSGVASGGPTGKPINIKLFGEDLEASKEVAEKYGEILEDIDGVYNIDISAKDGVPQLYINIKEKKAQTLGLTATHIALQLRGKVDGITAATIKDGREEIDVIIKIDEMSLKDISQIERLYINTPSGELIPLRSVAVLEELRGVSSIKHEDRKRVIEIEADLRKGFNINDVMNTFDAKSAAYVLPEDIQVAYGGDVEGIQENFANLIQSMILAVFLVFIILTIQFSSIVQPFVILSTVPMALIGVIWGLALTNNDFGFYSFMGLVALVGIAVNNAIILIDYMNYLRKEGKDLISAIKEAGAVRFNPVLATTMTTVSGVLPLAFKERYYAQFSFALIFGLLVTTILTLIFIPVTYSIIEGYKLKRVKNKMSI
ncbi:MAG: efflux RND transporter permease subunit [Clostridia bacterium]|nr:efflux RND transporter permease subunit [Clostridia bacterium]